MSEVINVPEGWKSFHLKKEIKILSGFAFGSEKFNESKNGIQLIRIRDLSNNYSNTFYNGIYSEEYLVNNGDILIGMDGEFYVVKWDGMIGLLNQRVCKVKDSNINYLLLFYALKPHIQEIENITPSTTVKHLSVSDIYNLNLVLPKEKKEQEKIAKILSTLDVAIESTQKLIDKEKNIKKGLMNDLLQNGIDKNGKIRTPQAHKYKDSELGLIPEEWEISNISLLVKNLDSKRIPLKEGDRQEISGQYPYYGASGIIDWVDDFIFDGEYILLGEDGENVVSRVLPLAFKATGKIWVNNHAHVFQCKKDVSIDYVVNLLENTDYKSIINGSAQPKITQDGLNKLLFRIAPKNEQGQIAKVLNTQDKKIEKEEENLAKLKELKKALMNDLLSGKVRVKV